MALVEDFQVFVWICVLAIRNKSSQHYQYVAVELRM